MGNCIGGRLSSFCLVCLALLFVAGLPTGARAASSPAWLRAKSDGFVIYSDGSQKTLVEFAVRYAAFKTMFREFFLPPGGSLPPSVLILLDRGRNQRAYLPSQTSANSTVVTYSAVVDGTAVMAVSMSDTRDQAIAEAIEFETIWALRRIGYYAPIWMAQGAGRVMSTLTITRGKCRFDDLVEGYGWAYYLNHTALPWTRFFAITEESPEYTGKKDFGTYHAQALALMDWILLSDRGTQERFAGLSRKLNSLPDSEAVQAVMQVPPEKFRNAIYAHFRDHSRRNEFPFDETKVRTGLEIGPANEVEVLVQTTDLLAAEGRTDKCEQQLARVRLIAPELACVKEALARQALREKNGDEAARLYREAIAAGSTDPFAYLVSARTRLEATSAAGIDQEGSGGRSARLAVDEIKKAIALNPGDAESYTLLGRAYYLLPEVGMEQLVDLNQGLALATADWSVRFYRALLYLRLGRTGEARADFSLLLNDPHVSEYQHHFAQAQMSNLEFNENVKKINALVGEQKFAEARALTDQAEKSEPDRTVSLRYRDLVRWIDKQEGRQQRLDDQGAGENKPPPSTPTPAVDR